MIEDRVLEITMLSPQIIAVGNDYKTYFIDYPYINYQQQLKVMQGYNEGVQAEK